VVLQPVFDDATNYPRVQEEVANEAVGTCDNGFIVGCCVLLCHEEGEWWSFVSAVDDG
jgi:hypothetical protein